MSVEAVGILERVFKAGIFVPVIALIAWWLLSSWLDRALTTKDVLIGYALLALASLFGLTSIVRGGWGFLGTLAFVYCALLAAACWQYIDWRRREKQRLLEDVARYREAIARDPSNAAAHSFLGETHLKLRDFDDATAALERALELDPKSKRDKELLRQARERRSEIKWRRLD
jgi:tetratricopeptide (TPR) repeat protein